jgi:hypothetical protein
MDYSDSDDEFEEKNNKMNELFPRLMCSPDINHYDMLDEVLVESDSATIYDAPDHFCYDGLCESAKLEHTTIIHIENEKDKFITYRDFYNAMQKWKQPMCDHHFLEGINVNTDTNVITLDFGS